MKQIIPTSQYKKDLKRYANQRKKMEALLIFSVAWQTKSLSQKIVVHTC